MRKTIVRTFVISTINATLFDVVDGEPEAMQIEPMKVLGKITEAAALRKVRGHYGKDALVKINSITEQEETYEISVEDFIKYAVQVVPQSN